MILGYEKRVKATKKASKSYAKTHEKATQK